MHTDSIGSVLFHSIGGDEIFMLEKMCECEVYLKLTIKCNETCLYMLLQQRNPLLDDACAYVMSRHFSILTSMCVYRVL